MIDAHCHFHTIKESNPEDLLNEAYNKGIKKILNIYEYSDRDCIKNINNFQNSPIKIYYGLGIHPCEVQSLTIDEAYNWLENNHNLVDVFGETGLDLYRNNTNKSQQLDYYSIHIELCKKYKKSVVIHARSCELNDLINLTDVTSMWHSFSFEKSYAKKVLDLNNSFLSFSGMVTFKSAKSIVESLEYCPLDRILVETDCPFLAPEPMRGKTNKPSFIYHTYKFIANIKNISIEQLISQVNINFKNFINQLK